MKRVVPFLLFLALSLSATAVCTAQMPSGTYKLKVISGPALPDNLVVELTFSVDDSGLSSTMRENDGTGWKNVGTATYTQIGQTGIWEMSMSSGTKGLLSYNEGAGAWELIVLSGKHVDRVTQLVR